MEVKTKTIFKAPVRLLTPSGQALVGQTYDMVTCLIQKQAGTPYTKSLVASDWTEIDATNFPGLYDLELGQLDLDKVGFLKYSVRTASSGLYVGVIGVVGNTAADIVKLIGQPIITLARDVIEAGRIVTNTSRKVK